MTASRELSNWANSASYLIHQTWPSGYLNPSLIFLTENIGQIIWLALWYLVLTDRPRIWCSVFISKSKWNSDIFLRCCSNIRPNEWVLWPGNALDSLWAKCTAVMLSGSLHMLNNIIFLNNHTLKSKCYGNAWFNGWFYSIIITSILKPGLQNFTIKFVCEEK